MKLKNLERLLTLGLTVKVLALVLMLIVAGPLFRPGPPEVEAQQEAQQAADQAVQDQVNQDQQGQAQDQGGGENQGGISEGAAQAMSKARANDKNETNPKAAIPEEGPQVEPPAYNPELINLLEQKKAQLQLEEQRINEERKALVQLRMEVTERIAELKKVQGALEKLVSAEQEQRKARIQQLVKVISNMRAESAAAVVAKLDDQMAVEIFDQMQSRTAGKVMAGLKPEQAARISILLAKVKEAKEAAKMVQDVTGGQQPSQP